MTDDSKQYVTDIHEFRTKWGTKGAGLLIEAFVEKAPAFEGDSEIAKKLGEMIGDLQFALERLRP